MKTNPSRYALPRFAALAPYVPGRQMNEAGWIKLNTNELPYPPSPQVNAAIEAEFNRLVKYPDPQSRKLREVIARYHRLDPACVMPGNGSDDVLNVLCRVFADEKRSVGTVDPSYSLYPILASIQGATLVRVPLDPGFALPVEAIAASGANLFYLTSPNAPSGTGYSSAQIRRVAGSLDGILAVDEAYANFADEDATRLVPEVPNLVVTRTFSKAFGLAGLRVGYALGHPDVIALLDRVRDPYNLDRLAQAAAAACLEDSGYAEAVIGKVKRIRDFYQSEFTAMGWGPPRSQANFLLVRPQREDGKSGPEVAESLLAFLEENRILVRYFPNHPLTREYLRISVGNEEQMDQLREVIDQWTKTTA